MEIKSRKQAALDGDSKYYTGAPCVNKHDAPKYTATGGCVVCNGKRSKEYQATIMEALHGNTVKVSVRAHPDDVKAIQDMAELLRVQRAGVPE